MAVSTTQVTTPGASSVTAAAAERAAAEAKRAAKRAAAAERAAERDTPEARDAAKRAAAAAAAAERLGAALKSSAAAGVSVLVAEYGADVTPAAVRLAKRAADEAAGLSKSRGGNRAAVLAVLAAVGDALPTDAVCVAAARATLDAEAKRKRDRTAHKRALADILNDSAQPLDRRAAALETLSGMDATDEEAKRAAAARALEASLNRALAILGADVVERAAVDAVAQFRAAVAK